MLRAYSDIISDAEPVLTLVLRRKSGRIPKGTYGFLEYYCTEPSCDCRRVMVLVMNEKMKPKAAISFGFDQEGPFAGPYLDTSSRQSPYAEELLHFFVDGLNSNSPWLDRLYRHYRAVREKVEGKRYRAKPFPKAGELVYQAKPAPDLAAEIEQSLMNLKTGGWSPHASKVGEIAAVSPPVGPLRDGPPPEAVQSGMASFVARYVTVGNMGRAADLSRLQDDLRQYLLKKTGSGEELALLLPQLYQQSPQPDEQIQAALRLLYDSLDILDEEIEDGTDAAHHRMVELQNGLDRHVFMESEDPDLRAAVLNILVQSKVELLPVLTGGMSHLLAGGISRTDLPEVAAEEALAGIARSFESMGVVSPFEGVQELQQLLVMDEAEMQVALVGEMLESDIPLLREIAVLMLFHHRSEVRLGVAQLLSAVHGKVLTPDSLRRLIVSRNWFPAVMRKHVDQAITNGRKAHVECAPLPNFPVLTVYATSIEGTGEQSFQVIVPEGSGHARCSVILKEGEGVLDSFVFSLATQSQLDELLKSVKRDPRFLESTAEHFDLRVCNALADGARAGNLPDPWLVRVVELLGRDRWRMVSFDPARELLQLQEELATANPLLLADREYRSVLDNSARLAAETPFLASWYEDGESVDRAVEAAGGKRGKLDADAAVDAIVDDVLEKRRAIWLARLTVTALWLKSSRKPPLPWHKMYHLAQAVADDTLPLKEIPLMKVIAEASLSSYLASNASATAGRGRKK